MTTKDYLGGVPNRHFSLFLVLVLIVNRILSDLIWLWSLATYCTSAVWILFKQTLSNTIQLLLRGFFACVIKIAFTSVVIIGANNIPNDGPVLFVSNHPNQFVDGMLVFMNSRRKVGFMMAAKSWQKPLIGHLGRIMGCIPVVRQHDTVLQGTGHIKTQRQGFGELNAINNRVVVVGKDTQFTSQLEPGDQIAVGHNGPAVRIDRVIDDTHVIVAKPVCDANGKPLFEFGTFGIYKRVDQSKTFEHVYAHLKRGDCIGIFPEGGSHDRTDLLPLKAGVAILALGVKDKYNINAAVVPVGLTYFRGHRFRGRVVIEFGTPLTVESDELALYHQDKRKACNAFLGRIEEGMRSVIVTTPDYNVMQLVYAARRLFQPAGVRLSAQETQDLNRRFAEAYKILSTTPEASKDLTELQKKVEEYNRTLRLMALKDHQVPFIAWWTVHDVIGAALYGALVFLMASLPTFVLNAPVGILARYVANAEQKRALRESIEKFTGRDVLLSKKLVVCTMACPLLWVVYTMLLTLVTDWALSTLCMVFTSFSFLSALGVFALEASMVRLQHLRPICYRLVPEYRQLQHELQCRREQLHEELHELKHKYKRHLGPLVDPERLHWAAFMHSRSLHRAILNCSQHGNSNAQPNESDAGTDTESCSSHASDGQAEDNRASELHADSWYRRSALTASVCC